MSCLFKLVSALNDYDILRGAYSSGSGRSGRDRKIPKEIPLDGNTKQWAGINNLAKGRICEWHGARGRVEVVPCTGSRVGQSPEVRRCSALRLESSGKKGKKGADSLGSCLIFKYTKDGLLTL